MSVGVGVRIGVELSTPQPTSIAAIIKTIVAVIIFVFIIPFLLSTKLRRAPATAIFASGSSALVSSYSSSPTHKKLYFMFSSQVRALL